MKRRHGNELAGLRGRRRHGDQDRAADQPAGKAEEMDDPIHELLIVATAHLGRAQLRFFSPVLGTGASRMSARPGAIAFISSKNTAKYLGRRAFTSSPIIMSPFWESRTSDFACWNHNTTSSSESGSSSTTSKPRLAASCSRFTRAIVLLRGSPSEKPRIAV